MSLSIVLSFFLSVTSSCLADSFEVIDKPSGIKVTRVAKGLGIPWGMAFISEHQLLVTQRSGSVYLLDIKHSKKTKLTNLPKVYPDGQGGMLDVAISPEYKKSGWIYFTYVRNINDEGVTVLARAKLKATAFINWQELLVTKSATDTGRHFGSRIAFDGKGHVFFGVGDRGVRKNAQDLTNHAGTIIRLKVDGTVPPDNPFINDKTALPEIWSYGHRNPQGLVYDKEYKRLWEIEHGPRGGDEINLVKKGANYGWPVISYGKEYWGPIAVGEGTHKAGMEQPKKVYIPSIAPGSLLVYTGSALENWKGNLFSGALKLRHLNRIILDSNGNVIKEERLFSSLDQRIRALAQSPAGLFYMATDSGNIYQVKPGTH